MSYFATVKPGVLPPSALPPSGVLTSARHWASLVNLYACDESYKMSNNSIFIFILCS